MDASGLSVPPRVGGTCSVGSSSDRQWYKDGHRYNGAHTSSGHNEAQVLLYTSLLCSRQVWSLFVQLAGGSQPAPLVVRPTHISGAGDLPWVMVLLALAGGVHVVMTHSHSELTIQQWHASAQRLHNFTSLWFCQFRSNCGDPGRATLP